VLPWPSIMVAFVRFVKMVRNFHMVRLVQFFYQVSSRYPGDTVASNMMDESLSIMGQLGVLVWFVVFVRKF